LTDLQDGAYLFAIYIVAADADCTISFSGLTQPPGPIYMDPFLDGPGLRRLNQAPSVLFDTTGSAWLGAQTPEDLQEPANNIPLFRSSNERAFGMRPASAGNLYAGIETAPGVSMGRIYIGGSVTGIVDIKGNLNEFYANNILTGTASGVGATGSTDISKNFHVGGDLQNIAAGTSFGTLEFPDPTTIDLKTGFELEVGGRLGQMRAVDSILAQVVVRNDVSKQGFGTAQNEFEFRGPNQPLGFSYFDPIDAGPEVAIGDNTIQTLLNNNDTFDNAQWLGTTRSEELGLRNTIQLKGSLNSVFGNQIATADNLDFYAVPLLAGQTMQVQLIDELQVGTNATLRLGIFDPDNRLIASDYSNVRDGLRAGKRIRIKADRPGAYRVVIGRDGDPFFTGQPISSTQYNPYELRISGIGDIALGGVIAENHVGTNDVPIFNPTQNRTTGGKGIQVLNGDLGEVRAGIVGNGTVFSLSDAWYIPTGNLRAIEGGSLGITDGTTFFLPTGPDFLVRKGKVGLLRNTNPTLELSVNDNFGNVASVVEDTAVFPNTSADLSLTPKQLAVGGDIQLVDAAGNLEGALLTNGSIGVIHAGVVGFAALSFAVWQVNVDGSGPRGVIDLVDVTGNFNQTAITTGPEGNVRNMRIGGVIDRDPFFGSGPPEVAVYAPGEQATLTDDGGTQFTLTGLPRVRNPIFGPGQPEFTDAPQLSVLAYPIRDKAGQVTLNVTVTPVDDLVLPTAIGGGGVQIESSARGSNASVEIGQVVMAAAAAGQTLVFDPFTRQYTVTAIVPPVTTPVTPVRNIDVVLKGSSRIDIWEMNFAANTVVNSISNGTKGDIVNITGTPDIISLSGESIGLAKSSTGAAVEGATVLDSTYPFLQQRNLIQVSDLVSVSARKGIGNILADNIGTVRANSDGKNDKNVHEGIEGPIVARHPNNTISELTGNIIDVRVGEGIKYSGSGNVGFSGLFAAGLIDSVEARGSGNDIRGDIIAGGVTNILIDQPLLDANGVPVLDAFGNPVVQSTPPFAIGTISASKGAAIIDSDIMVVGDVVAGVGLFDQSEEGSTALGFVDNGDSFDEPLPDIAEINIDGNGGVLGAFIVAADVGTINVDNGFGVINSRILSTGSNTIEGIKTDGYGVRDTQIDGGGNLRQVIARGKGKRLDTRSFTSSARLSEKTEYNESGLSLTAMDDLHLYLGTKKSSPKRKGVSEAGMIVDCQIRGSRELGKIEAWRILARNTTTIDPATGDKVQIPPLSLNYPMQVSFGTSSNRIVVGDVVDGLALTSGAIDLFQAGGNVSHTLINSAGRIKKIQTGGALRGTTQIRAIGAEGQIDNVITKKGLFARVNSTLDISNITVGSDLGSSSISTNRNLGTLKVKGSILSGSSVTVKRALRNLIVGKNIQEDATVKAGSIQSQSIGGQVDGDIIIV
jgi:hypothetical protein